jgi:lipopolysaccharide transport system ATP-binding protein
LDSDANTAIRVRGVGKCYRIYRRPADRIRELWSPTGRTCHEPFWALRDVAFEVAAGETVGLIGPNGSGKSTLLEILCGTLTPTEGSVEVDGRVAALLELGAGFNPEFSGRENVFMNASILNIPRQRVVERFDEICAFAEIGEYIDRPVKTYSSGMYVRLAFATAIHTDPDVLIIDEALAVGDIRFQRKCYRQFHELQARGVTILFVTHAVELIRAHCHRAIFLERGRVRDVGDPRTVVHSYLDSQFGARHGAPDPGRDAAASAALDRCRARSSYNLMEYRWGDGRARIVDYELRAGEFVDPRMVASGSRVEVAMRIRFLADLSGLIYGLTVKTVDGITVFGSNSRERDVPTRGHVSGDETVVRFSFVARLVPGEYFISLGVAVDDNTVDNLAIDRRYDLIHLTIDGPGRNFGIADLGLEIAELDVPAAPVQAAGAVDP